MNRIKGRETVAMTLSIKAKEAIKTALAMTKEGGQASAFCRWKLLLASIYIGGGQNPYRIDYV
jgi:hypothetical protein